MQLYSMIVVLLHLFKKINGLIHLTDSEQLYITLIKIRNDDEGGRIIFPVTLLHHKNTYLQ
jgi:hypothetical protein